MGTIYRTKSKKNLKNKKVENKKKKKILLYDPEKTGSFRMMFGFAQPAPYKFKKDVMVKANKKQKE